MTDKTPYGIAYPIQRGETGYFNPSYDSLDAIKNSITNFVLTRKGSRPGRPSYGSSLWNFLFENIEDPDAGFSDIFIETIKDEIIQYHPSLLINEFNITPSPDTNTISIEVKFSYINSSQETLSLNISV